MSTRLVFQPIADSVYRDKDRDGPIYTWHSSGMDLWDECRRGRSLHGNCGFYPAYNDGTCQHSPEAAVQVESASVSDNAQLLADLDSNTAAIRDLEYHIRNMPRSDWQRKAGA